MRALLVGASDYDTEAGIADLRGPANDVQLLERVLLGRGVSDIEILADGVDGAARPTRAAILAGFESLADRTRPGDLVYIHLSGHGTRQADLDGDETDGLDEVFLPVDVARAEPGSGVIPNALVDDEIGAAVRAIRERGADVWLVLDSCHSGSGLRAASPDTATRFVDPAVLGVSVTATPAPDDAVLEATGPEPEGGLLAFYAAQSSEVAREVNLAAGDGAEAWYGLFTAKLAGRLEGGAALSYRQLFQAVLSDMNDATVPGAARLQTPLWEGDMIDAAVFGGAETAALRRFAVTGDEIAAGTVHGLGEGTLLGLVDDAAASPEAIIGYAQMEAVEATQAYLRPVSADCVPRAGAPCASVGRLPDTARFAQVVARPVDLVVRIGLPRDAKTAAPLPAESRPVQALVSALAELQDRTGPRITLDMTQFDVDVLWDGTALWFGPTAIIGESPVGLSWVPGEAPLAPLLERIARAENLARTLAEVAGAGSLLNPSPVELSAEFSAVPVGALAGTDATVSPVRECRTALSRAGSPQPLPAAVDLKQCDQVSLSARGTVAGAYDVNRVHIDAQFCVHAAHERIEDARAARALGPAMTLCSDCPTGYSAGQERLFVVVTESRPNAEPLNLQGLVETCGAGGATRGAAAERATSFLGTLARRPDTRGAFGGVEIADIWVDRWSWQVLPRQEAFRRFGRDVEVAK